MGKNSTIGWTHSTFNPWWGCSKVSQECTRCYAETFAKRVGHRIWGDDAPRRFFGDAHWNEPLKWDRDAAKAGERRRVFCASMADVFEDRDELNEHRARLWDLISKTPHLDWLLLTKRPENMLRMVPAEWHEEWAGNVWAGTTIGHPDSLERLDHLARVPAVVRFVSVEPLLADLDLGLNKNLPGQRVLRWHRPAKNFINWVIVGSESGAGARPMDIEWARSIVNQCVSAGVKVFVKQIANEHDRKGGDPKHWPMGNWPRELPAGARSADGAGGVNNEINTSGGGRACGPFGMIERWWQRITDAQRRRQLRRISRQLGQTMGLLLASLQMKERIMAAIDDLRAKVEQNTTVDGSAIALLDSLKQRLDDALAGGNLEADITALSTDLGNSSEALAAAVSRNTPADTNPPA